MPTYNFTNNKTKEQWTDIMSIAARDLFLEENPDVTQDVASPMICDPVRVGVKSKPDGGFRDVLKHIKDNNIRSNINTF